jgi:hypothetical protein
MALLADSGPVTSVGRVSYFVPPDLLRRGEPDPICTHTGLQTIDGLVCSLGLVSLGHDGRNAFDELAVVHNRACPGERTSSTPC